MKKLLLTAATAAASLSAFSADQFYVIMKDGSVESYPTEKVDSISFNDPQIAKIMGFGDMMQEIAKLKEEIASLKAGVGVKDTSVSDLRYNIISDTEVEVVGFNTGTPNLVIPDKVTLFGKEYTVTRLGHEAFSGQDFIKTVEFRTKSLTQIRDTAFDGCDGLKSLILPEGVTFIGGDAFRGCANLTSVEIPSSVTSIGSGAFNYCNNLDVVIDNVPENVSVAKSAFSNCKSIQTKDGSDFVPVAPTSISLVEGASYQITQWEENVCTFKVVSTSGSYEDDDLAVVIEIDGKDYTFSGEKRYLIYDKYTDIDCSIVGYEEARKYSYYISAVLSISSSNYTMISPSLDPDLDGYKGKEVEFMKLK